MNFKWYKIFIIGLGFFTVSLAWSIYNSYVPVFLDRLIDSSTLIAVVMTFDNIFGIIFQPYFGALSDKTSTKLGRRIPFLLIGIPLASIFFALIPLHKNVIMLMLFVIGMNFFMSVYRAPVVALMPDYTPEKNRSKANGVINLMGGLGAALALFIGGKLFDQNESYPFFLGGILMVFAMIVLLAFFKEPKEPYSSTDINEETDSIKLIDFRNIGNSLLFKNSNLSFILFSIFFFFCGYNAIETFFTLFCRDTLGLTPGNSSQLLALLFGTFLVASIPAGFIGSKIGKKLSILFGLIIIATAFVVVIALPSILVIKIALPFGGLGGALIIINSYPIVVEMAPKGKTGLYTGYYYAFSFSASILSPILFGFISDLTGNYKSLFTYSFVAFCVSIICLIKVKYHHVIDADNLQT